MWPAFCAPPPPVHCAKLEKFPPFCSDRFVSMHFAPPLPHLCGSFSRQLFFFSAVSFTTVLYNTVGGLILFVVECDLPSPQ